MIKRWRRMVDVEADGFSGTRRIDMITVAGIVLAVDAVIFLLIAILGVPALAWLFGDELASWRRLWLVVLVWVVSLVLGPLCTAATLRITGRGSYSIRRTAMWAAGGTAAATGALALASLIASPSALTVVAALFAVVNVAAAREFYVTPEIDAEPLDVEPFDVEPPAEAEPDTESDLIEIEETTRPTVDLGPVPAPRRIRSRGPAAMHTLAGIKLPPRARRR
jgi:hypothetical protein